MDEEKQTTQIWANEKEFRNRDSITLRRVDRIMEFQGLYGVTADMQLKIKKKRQYQHLLLNWSTNRKPKVVSLRGEYGRRLTGHEAAELMY